MKRLGIDARFYGIAGPGRYVSNLLKNLEGKVNFEVYVFLAAKGFNDYQPQDKRFHKVQCNVPWYSWLEQIVLPFVFLRYRLDLLHVPHFNFPVLYPGRLVLTVHDLIIDEFSTERATTKWPFYYRFKRLVYGLVVWWGLVRALKVLVPSQFVKRQLIVKYHCSIEKVVVTHEAADLYGGGVYKSWGPYLLYVGSMYPHKNLERLVKAFIEIKKEGIFSGDLVLAGKDDYFSKRLQQEIKNYGEYAQEIIFPATKTRDAYIADSDLIIFYQNATALVFPSLSEGFGLPPLEAMNLRCPVVASCASSVPEVCGDAALYFDPRSVEDIKEKLKKIITDETLRQDLVRKGLENVKRFSWGKMAEETLKVYESCLGS
jgi:glycosyltransferase involved in cell wall biosynthesis